MALEIIDKKIVGTIDNLEDKLNGEIPVTREELLVLVDSWGRSTGFYTKDSQNKDMYIEECEATQSEQALLVRCNPIPFVEWISAKECYDLSKLDVSQITNMSDVFIFSKFNGNISSWNMSSVTDISGMFSGAENFNQDISSWDISNVTNIEFMFNNAINFNQNIFNWDFSNVKKMQYIFQQAEKIINKYNNGEDLPNYTDDIKEWIINNRDRMNMIDLKEKHGDEIDNFFSKYSLIKNNNLLTECNKQSL